MAGIYFAMGFLTTNLSFQRSAAAYVETIKAAEPITSAGIAVLWGIETLSPPEVTSLAAIVSGVLLSTLGNARGETPGRCVLYFCDFMMHTMPSRPHIQQYYAQRIVIVRFDSQLFSGNGIQFLLFVSWFAPKVISSILSRISGTSR